MKSKHFFLLGIVLIIGQFVVRITADMPAGIYTNLDMILDISLLIGFSLIFMGIVYTIVIKLNKK
jgi:hypothetical protein